MNISMKQQWTTDEAERSNRIQFGYSRGEEGAARSATTDEAEWNNRTQFGYFRDEEGAARSATTAKKPGISRWAT